MHDEAGISLWSESHPQVMVNDGVFSLIIGSSTPFDGIDFDGRRFLGISLGGDSEMVPRQELGSSFFAMRAGVADMVKAASVDSEAIADSAITSDKMAAGVTITAEERSKLEGLVSD